MDESAPLGLLPWVAVGTVYASRDILSGHGRVHTSTFDVNFFVGRAEVDVHMPWKRE